MGILFSVPRVATSNNFSQQGPTCWYYAGKSLIELHNLRVNLPGFEGNWKELHQLRKIVSELSSDSDLPDAAYNYGWVRGRLQATADQLNGFITREDQLQASPHGWYRTHELKKLPVMLQRQTGVTSMQQARVLSDRATNARAKITTLGHVNNRLGIFNAFIPGTFVLAPIPRATLTKAWLEDSLKANGPFYAAGNIWSKGTNRITLDNPLRLNTPDTTVLVKELDPTSSHAVIIVGILGGLLYYKDPNDFTELRFINFETFKTGWVIGGSATSYQVDCAHRLPYAAGRGGCHHNMARIIKTI